jgi:hypothetical protein
LSYLIQQFDSAVIAITPLDSNTTLCVEPGSLVKWVNETDDTQLITFHQDDKFLFGMSSMEIAPRSSTVLTVPEDTEADKDHRYRFAIVTRDYAEYLIMLEKANEEAKDDDPEWVPYGPPALIVCPPGTSPCN